MPETSMAPKSIRLAERDRGEDRELVRGVDALDVERGSASA
jgi:hypothetical protein